MAVRRSARRLGVGMWAPPVHVWVPPTVQSRADELSRPGQVDCRCESVSASPVIGWQMDPPAPSQLGWAPADPETQVQEMDG